MQTIYSIAGLAAAAAVIYCVSDFDWRKVRIPPIPLIIILGLIARFALISVNAGYENDLNCFRVWADRLYHNGFSQIYFNGEDVDYTPGYMYALYTLGALRNTLNLPDSAFDILVKLPAILCDIITSCIIYRLAAKKFKKLPAMLFGLAYALNPAIITDSVIWGQIDSVHTLLLFASILALSEGRRLFSYIAMAIAVLVKPQSFVLSPVFIYDAMNNVFSPAQVSALKRAGIICLKAAAAVLAVVILTLPFIRNFDFLPIIDRYQKTLSAYPYATLNAYNLYAFLGANWKPINEAISFGLTYAQLGYVFIALISLYCIYILHKGKCRKSAWLLCAGALFILTFMLSVKMHERYLYPALVFLLAAYIYTRDKRLILFYIAYSALFTVNCADVLNMVQNGNTQLTIAHSMPFISLLNIIITSVFAISALRMSISPPAADRPDLPAVADETPAYPSTSGSALRLGRNDWLIMALLTAAYSAVAFYNLGDTAAPQTAWHANANQYAVFELDTSKPIKQIAIFVGARPDKKIILSASDDRRNWSDIVVTDNKGDEKEFELGPVFRWLYKDTDFSARYVRVKSLDNDLFIQEMAFIDEDAGVAPISVKESSAPGEDYIKDDPLISQDPALLCDEQAYIPAFYSFSNSTYFDEIYHARTAYEFIHHLPVYEWTHPPLGKDIISWGILIFGMTPFGWRFAGTLTGALMLPVIYIFAKKMFRGSDWAFFVTSLFTLDFMHFAQTRIATIDGFVTFFIMLMYLFMYLYYSLNFFELKAARVSASAIVTVGNDGAGRPGRIGLNPKGFRHSVFVRSLVYLLFCGIFTGLAAAAKWEGIYAMAGLPVLFFYTLYRRWLEYKSARAEGDFDEDNWNLKYFPAYTAVTLACCAVFFIAIPVLLYALSYIPYMHTPDHPTILKNQIDMFRYHTELVSTHDYSSYWFQWPVMQRPIYYFSGKLANGLSTGITSFGSPAVWWTGIAAALYCINAISKRFNKDILFLLVAYGSQYLPWILVSRTTYIYHYFPSVPFVILLIAYMFKDWVAPRKPLAVALYILLALLLFIAFYPAISAYPIPMRYVNMFLRWLPTWSLS